MTRDRYNPLRDPEAVACPAGCGWLTDDPYGGPCWDCWAELGLGDPDGDTPSRRLFRRCDEDCMDVYPLARPTITVHATGGLL